MAVVGGTRGGGSSRAAVSVLAVVVVGVTVVVVVAPRFPAAVFSLSFSLLLLRCLFPPPPSHPPASPLHHLRFTESPYLRRSVGMMAHGKDLFGPGGGGGSLKAARVPVRPLIWLCGCGARRRLLVFQRRR